MKKLTVNFQPHGINFVHFLHERVRGPTDQLQVDVLHLGPEAEDADRSVPVAGSLQKK